MEITKTCPFCGAVHTLDVDVEPRAIEEWVKGKLIQEAMPHLTDDEREHIKTGICINCWAHDPDEEEYTITLSSGVKPDDYVATCWDDLDDPLPIMIFDDDGNPINEE